MTRQEIEATFLLSGIVLYDAVSKNNPYSQDMHILRGPIWLCSTNLGLIIVGWRKRVIEIDWTAIGEIKEILSGSSETGYTRWLTLDDTDQGPNYVHSWGLQSVPRYLADLRVAIKDDRLQLKD